MIARSFTAHGRVQGVFFRDSVRQEAERLGVAGRARNEAGGTVSGVLEGDADAVQALLAFMRADPGSSSVEQVEVAEASPEGLRGFETA